MHRRAIGPFIRLFDATYSIDDVRNADLSLTISGRDGFVLKGSSTMREISRDPLDLVSPDDRPPSSISGWLVLFMGTLFAPVEDRDAPGSGLHPQARRCRDDLECRISAS